MRVVNRGMRVSGAEALARLRAGLPVAPGDIYMRGAPVFDVPDGPHQGLRERLFVCSIAPAAQAVRIAVYAVG